MKELINDWAKFYGISIHSIEKTNNFCVITIYEDNIVLRYLDNLRDRLEDYETGWSVFSIDRSQKVKHGLDIWLCL